MSIIWHLANEMGDILRARASGSHARPLPSRSLQRLEFF